MKYLLFFLLTVTLFSQQNSLYIPRNIEDAYLFNTRSYNGKPGENYWINSADYKISTEIIPSERKVVGHETITYHNNSPDDLDIIVMRIYQDLYKKGNTRDWEIDSLSLTNGVEITKLKVNGKEYSRGVSVGQYTRQGTNLAINLSEVLKSKSTLDIEVSWYFFVPVINKLRMGFYDYTSAFISYWYPQISVYDDIDGWDLNDYKGTVEMYNDFNNYDVSIEVPKNFIVWATGLLQNPEEVLQEGYLKKLNEAKKSDKIVNIIGSEDLSAGNITKQEEKNIWKYKAEHVPDFALAISDHYLWDATSLEVEEGRRVLIDAAYNPASSDFYEVASIARKSINYLSNELPGVPYPYPAMTIFNGHGGMEYPMMVNDGKTDTRSRTVGLTAHEITHTYFPFYTGTNERKYAWMDEGWAVVIPYDFQSREAPEYDPRDRNMNGMQSFSGQEMEMPPMVPNVFLTGKTYRAAVYSRAGLAYDYLKDFLGNDLFKTALKEYIHRWNGKHPGPYDFFFTFNNVVGEDLSWFWKPWFFEPGYADLAVDKVFTYENSYELYIKKPGKLPVPVMVNITYTDGTTSHVYKTAEVWKNGNTEYVMTLDRNKDIKKITLGDEHILDVEFINNEVLVE
jgi:hypothetical protein